MSKNKIVISLVELHYYLLDNNCLWILADDKEHLLAYDITAYKVEIVHSAPLGKKLSCMLDTSLEEFSAANNDEPEMKKQRK
ncbi:hypothetical protein ACH5RR_014927 [Cinchona calisaya]|uniref:Uncharacterized protein n=1 Tax=Cinchona calisaya TaxID=153742 RepID=A0ABD2ZWY6_9GENT